MMKWDIGDAAQNTATIKWPKMASTIVKDKLTALFVLSPNLASALKQYASAKDGGHDAVSRRWRLIVEDVPKSAWFGNRTLQATFYGQDATVTDGSTFGDVSICEVSPVKDDQIELVVDFTKVRSQDHQFGLQILVIHGCKPLVAESGKPDKGKELPR